MNYPYPCIAGFRLSFGEEEFITLIKPEAAFKFDEKKESNSCYQFFFLVGFGFERHIILLKNLLNVWGVGILSEWFYNCCY